VGKPVGVRVPHGISGNSIPIPIEDGAITSVLFFNPIWWDGSRDPSGLHPLRGSAIGQHDGLLNLCKNNPTITEAFPFPLLSINPIYKCLLISGPFARIKPYIKGNKICIYFQ